MKTENEILHKIKEHQVQIDYVQTLENVPEQLIATDTTRLEYGIKALMWVLSDDELLKPGGEKTYGDKCIHCGKEINPSFDPCCSLDCWSKEFD